MMLFRRGQETPRKARNPTFSQTGRPLVSKNETLSRTFSAGREVSS